MNLWDELKYDKNGLLTAIVVDDQGGDVIMCAFMNQEALRKTLETGLMHYYSRSRGKQWLKGETSGHTQEVRKVAIDCDGDALVFRVKQNVAACHTGQFSCFHRILNEDKQTLRVEGTPVFDPKTVY